ncbi:MAG: POTRA domain-containing protein [Selenomonadaceae bacterium]|nr:ShlB/FhaC/HecB family hemolysin secretion/activation protein [Selenomonadaceae bacterium]MDY2685216.1 POTRA domain-containing protein [Selenomonadaceae bacterium]
MSKNHKAGKAAWRVLTLMTAASVMAGGAVYAAVPPVPEKVQDSQHEINQNINALPVNPGRNGQSGEKQGTAEVENQLPEKGSEQQDVKFTIQNFRLDAREMHLNKEDLSAILTPAMDRPMTIADLNRTLDALTRYCRQHGYPAAAAYVPAQEAKEGVVLLKITPGRYGEVKLENHSKLKDRVAQSFVNGLKKGSIIETAGLETTLYSISDVSGTKAVGVLTPGKAFGTSDLTVRIENGKGENTVTYVENYGSKNAGRYRLGLQESLYDVGGTGAKLNAGTLLSNHDMHNFYVNYETLVGHGGTTLGVGVSRMDYELGSRLSDMGAMGISTTLSLFGSVPVYHLTDRMLRFDYGYDYRDMHDDLDAYNLSGKKHSHSVHAGLSGYWKRNGFISDYTFRLVHGTVGMDTWYSRLLGERSNTEGQYTKAEFSLDATHSLGHRTDVLVKTSAQLAESNLDGSEEFYLGGANGVRAYPQGEGSGDEGILGSAEFRYYTDTPGLVLSTYFDIGHVAYNKNGAKESVLNGVPKKGQTLKGWGLGAAYQQPDDWFARLDYARRIGGDENLTEDAKAKGRAWFMFGKIW